MAYLTAHMSARTARPAGQGGWLAGLRDMLRRRMIYNRTMRELRALSSRELADLGLTRAMITRVALEAAFRD